jgi:hypothetical protein
MSIHAVFYISINNSDELVVDGPFYGGKTYSFGLAEKLARDIINDKSLTNAIVVKIIEVDNGIMRAHRSIKKYFDNMIEDMREVHSTQHRMH